MPTTITGSTGVSKVQDGVITVEDLNGGGSGSAPVFGCRAWVNFDGLRDSTGALSTANTARLIRASGNVTSVVRNGTGDFTVNFATSLPDGNYAVGSASSDNARNFRITTMLAGSYRFLNTDYELSPVDPEFALLNFFR